MEIEKIGPLQDHDEDLDFDDDDDTYIPDEEIPDIVNNQLDGSRIINMMNLNAFILEITRHTHVCPKFSQFGCSEEHKIGLASKIDWKCICGKDFTLHTTRCVRLGEKKSSLRNQF